MLKGIDKTLSPDLLKVLCQMGHGDEIVIADGNFQAETFGQRVVRADGVSGTQMLNAVMSVLPLDTYATENVVMMELVPSDVGKINPTIWNEYEDIVSKHDSNAKVIHMERFAFYERCKKAFAVIATGEQAVYANIIIKKGVVK